MAGVATDPAVVDHWDLCCCPSCGGRLQSGARLGCADCGAGFPVVDGIPWLVDDAAGTLGEWRARLRALLGELHAQSQRYRDALSREPRRASTVARLTRMSAACADHAQRLSALLEPLLGSATPAARETYRALGTRLPATQGVAGYYANIHRDWCWGDMENEGGFRAIDAALGSRNPGATLVLGSGAGRLAYDLHVRRRPSVTIAADINPLMLAVARRMFEGETLELHEFPVAPRDLEGHAILRSLRAPAAAPAGLVLLGADAGCAPFATGAFDTVVTHWLVDVLDEDFASFSARLGQWLRPGGRWVNSGTFYFRDADAAGGYSTDELTDVLHDAGFTDVVTREHVAPYLASPASRHARMERLLTFAATLRTRVAAPPPHRVAPAWALGSDIPVPLAPSVASESLAMRVRSFVAALVDGRRTVDDIAGVLVEERLMAPDEARPAVRAFLERLFIEASRP